MNNLLKQLMLSGSVTALIMAPSVGRAQGTAPADNIETVNSSASRIELQGFEAPTPVTVIGIDTLNRDSKIQVGDEIRELPQVRGGTAIDLGANSGNLSQVNAGADTIAIRGLGSQRNLVLFDGQRTTSSNLQDGTVDLSLVPSALVQRIDVVTGGASAAWGSDAVTGVVNVVINKTFEGFKGNTTYSNSTLVADPTYKAEFAWGSSFLGGKLHEVAAANFTSNPTAVFPGDVARITNSNGRGFVYNPAYCNAIAYAGTSTTGGTCSSLSGAPLQVYAYGLGSTTSVVGGLTSANTVGTTGAPLAANALKGTMFVGDSATPTQFNYGTLYGASTCYNGCSNNQFGSGGWRPESTPYHSANYFNYISYQVTPDVKASVQLNYSRLSVRSTGTPLSNGTSHVVYADNPYLPSSIADQFVCQGGAVFGTAGATCIGTLSNGYNPYTQDTGIYTPGAGNTPGTYNYGALTLAQRQARPAQTLTAGFEYEGNLQNPSPTSGTAVKAVKYDYNTYCQAVENNCGYNNKAMLRGVFTLEGSLSDEWSWNTYVESSQARIKEMVQGPITGRVNNALDAVRVTSGNVGTSGLPIGSIQCRGLLNLSNAGVPSTAAISYGYTAAEEIAGCVPFNPFGTGAASTATLNYTDPSQNYRVTGILDSELVLMTQVEGAANMYGVLPWHLPAGEIGLSTGIEWRKDSTDSLVLDNRSRASMYPSGNFGAVDLYAHQHSEEGYLEIAAPLLKDDIVENMNLDVAGRVTDYSFSGLVETWKIGVTSQLTDDFKLRTTWSYDIRAPDNWDLYSPGSVGGQQCASFVTGPTGFNNGQPSPCFAIGGGNQHLNPDKSNTITAGVVMTPHWIPGLTGSVDWYQIHLHGGIITEGFGTVISRCQTGEIVYCKQIIFDQAGSDTNVQGCGNLGDFNKGCVGGNTLSQIDYVLSQPVNASLLTTAGFDFAMAYGFDIFAGTMDVSFNGNYMYDFSQTLAGISFQGAGNTQGFYSGGAKFEGTWNVNYRQGPISVGAQVRMTGDSIKDPGTEGQAGVLCGTPTFAKVTVNGATQNVATLSSGQSCSLAPNYNAIVAPVDLRAQYRWTNNITLFGAMDNVQNLPTAGSFLRRTFRAGVRFNY